MLCRAKSVQCSVMRRFESVRLGPGCSPSSSTTSTTSVLELSYNLCTLSCVGDTYLFYSPPEAYLKISTPRNSRYRGRNSLVVVGEIKHQQVF